MSKREDHFTSLAQGLLDAIQAMKQLGTQLHENASTIGHLEERAISLQRDVEKLYAIIFEGNGQPSVPAQFMRLSGAVESLQTKMDNLETMHETMRRERIRSWTAILVALISAGAAIAVGILK